MDNEEEAARRAKYRAQREQRLEDRAIRDSKILIVEFRHDASVPADLRHRGEQALLAAAQALKEDGLEVFAYRHSYATGHEDVLV